MSFSASTNNAQAPYSSPTSALGKKRYREESDRDDSSSPRKEAKNTKKNRSNHLSSQSSPSSSGQSSTNLAGDANNAPADSFPNAINRPSQHSSSPATGRKVYHVFRKDLEEATGGVARFKVALQAHVRLLSLALTADKLRNLTQALPGGSIGSKIATISENQVRLIFARVSSVGLNSWTPDFLGSVSSLWNELHESIALDTFRQACMNRAYETFGVEMKFVLNSELAIGLYRNFVFHHLLNNIRKEQKNPGAVQKELDLSKVYKRRKHRAEERLKYLEMLKWNPRISTILSSPSCHSDDEDSPDKKEFFRLLLPLRNPKVTVFVEHLDDYRNKTRAYDHCRNAYKEIPRVPHPLGKISSFAHKLPKPIDPDEDDDAEERNLTLPWTGLTLSSSMSFPLTSASATETAPLPYPLHNLLIPTKEEINGVNDDGEETDWEGDSSVETDDEEEDDENAEGRRCKNENSSFLCLSFFLVFLLIRDDGSQVFGRMVSSRTKTLHTRADEARNNAAAAAAAATPFGASAASSSSSSTTTTKPAHSTVPASKSHQASGMKEKKKPLDLIQAIEPIFKMVYLLTAWLTLYAGLSQADANIVLKAIQLILTTTLKLVNQALSLLEFDIPGQRLPTYSSPKGVMVAARVYPNIADLLASKKYIGFGSLKSFYFCTFCTSHRDNLDNLDYQSWTPRSGVMVRQQALNWKNATTLAKKEELHKTNGVQYSPTLELPYFDPIAHTVIGVMHNRLEGDLQHHLRVFWGIGRPDKRTKTGAEEMAEMQESKKEDEGEYSETDSEEAGSELEDLDLEASQAASASTSIENQEDREKTPTGINAPIGSLASLVIQVQDWNLIDMNMEDDLDYIPKSSEVFDFTKEQMQQIRSGLCNIGLPTSVARPPVNLGEKEHGKLKAQEELTLFSGMFPLILPEIWSRRTENEEADNTLHLACFCHLVAATNISMAYQTSDTAADKYMEHYVQYRNIAQSLYACWDPVPNHHFGMHIGSLLKFWGPLASLSEFPGERLNGSLANIQTNNHYSEMELTMIRQFGRKAQLTASIQDSRFKPSNANTLQDHPTSELLQILGSHLETYDNLDHSAAMTSAEVAEFFLHKKELAIIHYNALLNYLHASGRDYHAADDTFCKTNQG
ncbi:hypothetical protein DFJ43DRAFT_1151099 [Lentinula guzmanii]|uniref:Uncharacterized protein n=1 Tax=Lentinula guzmanii TaxID=2804957 RepID=A0AA38N2P7_9AGAR|nr:hypothetical protein DFJ43DRAFT_1151099 [Lentinula guzmanii]